MADPDPSAAEQMLRLRAINDKVLAALKEEAELALSIRLAAGWGEIAREISEAADALRRRSRGGDSFDISLAWFVAKELDALAAEIGLNLNLREQPQWPQ